MVGLGNLIVFKEKVSAAMAAVAADGEQLEHWKARAEKAEQEKRVLRMLLNAQKGKNGKFVFPIIQVRSFQIDMRRLVTPDDTDLHCWSKSIIYQLCVLRFAHPRQVAFKK